MRLITAALASLVLTVPTTATAAATSDDRSSSPSDDLRHAQVIILGGGIAGISAARALAAQNITDILLIEARPELGGRAYTETLRSPAGDVVIEKGCNWIQGPGKEPIQALAAKWGLKTTPTNYSDSVWFEGLGIEADGQRGRFLNDQETEEFMAGYNTFLEGAPGYSDWRTNNSLVDISVRVATSIMDWIPVNALQWAYEYWNIDYTFAQTPEESSFANAFSQEAGIENELDEFVIDPRGYKYIFVQEAREIFGHGLDDDRLRLGTTVRTIDYSAIVDPKRTRKGAPEIVVHTDKGSFAAPHVVTTFSVGVLQHQDVVWEPRLPDWKKEAIFTFAMATYQKFIMYADPDKRGRYTVWQNMNAPGYLPQGTEQNVIMVTTTGDFARRNEHLSDAEITDEVVAVLREMYDDVPDPIDIVVPRWSIDPLYRGTYSNWPLGAFDQHHGNLGQSIGGGQSWLHFSGEATSVEAFGYVQGAWEQGVLAADAVAACLGGNCPNATVYEAVRTCEQQETTVMRRGLGNKRPTRGGSPRRHAVLPHTRP